MTDNQISYRAAVRYARRHIQECCYGRPCLEECLRRLGASLPPCACAGGWRAPRWAKWLALAAVLAVVLFAALHSSAADVQCIWNGNTYVCSGTGSSIEVIGGGSGEPVTVTNFWGVCTNCVSMSPSVCETLKQDIYSFTEDLYGDLDIIDVDARRLADEISSQKADISTFRRFGYDPTMGSNLESFYAFTNYIYTVENTQTSLCRTSIPAGSSITARRASLSYNNGIYDYAQNLLPVLDSIDGKMSLFSVNSQAAKERLFSLREAVDDRLDCSQCQPEYEPGGSPGGGGSGSVTNGNWCTFDQGEAIKELLRDLKNWAERQHSQLVSISNYTEQCWNTLRSGLFSDYTAIPRGEDWQTLYLDGQPTAWGYDPTNIIQRIEVLLYGMSGISTNTASLEDTTPSAEDTVHDVSDAVSSIITDADGTEATTLGDAVLEFFRAFTPNTRDYRGGEEIVAEVSIQVGSENYYVPALRLGESGFLVDTMNTVKTCVNGFCSILFYVGGAFAIFRFWVWFAAWCVRLSKWAVELCTSLFAS